MHFLINTKLCGSAGIFSAAKLNAVFLFFLEVPQHHDTELICV
jgi:hypothetical protein